MYFFGGWRKQDAPVVADYGILQLFLLVVFVPLDPEPFRLLRALQAGSGNRELHSAQQIQDRLQEGGVIFAVLRADQVVVGGVDLPEGSLLLVAQGARARDFGGRVIA